ncbi:hypothetical protein BKA65DRAFT_142948 [Rhexocercosporidium sp. MPI-PUGE-AT-0058]|nr:hypothetical protein BKA65DRAFT_142948 [Rhexocercosporidium sp. MPI-PUGE-AT-0058]
MDSIRTEYPLARESTKMLRVVLPVGCMTGSAMVSPILSEFRGIWFTDILIFIVASIAYLLQHLAEVKTYGHFTVILAFFFGFAALSSTSTSLKELIPWIPIASCLLALLTALSLPKIHRAISDPNPNPEISMEEGHSNTFRGPIGVPRSLRSNGGYHARERSLEMDRLLALNVSNMIGRPQSRHSRGFSTHDSDIDLNDHAEIIGIALRRMVSPSRENFIPMDSNHETLNAYLPGYPQAVSSNRPALDCTSQGMNYSQRSASPESVVSQASQSTSGELEGLLRG